MSATRRHAWALHIAGHPWVYATRADFPIDDVADLWPVTDPVTAPVPAVVPTLQPPGPLSAELPLLGGVADESGVALSIAIRGRGAGDAGDVFARLGTRGAHNWGLVDGFTLDPGGADTDVDAITIDDDPPFDVRLDRSVTLDPDALASGHAYQIDIDGEACIALVVGGDDRRLRVTHRAIGGTTRRTHTVQADTRDVPVLTTWQLVQWRSRFATLVAVDIDATGTVGEPYEVMSGFIESTPTPTSDGTAIGFELSPLTALLKADASVTPSETTLVAGIHRHQAGVSDELDVFGTAEALAGGHPWEARTRDATAAASGVIDLDAEDVAAWESIYDPDLDAFLRSARSGHLSINRGEAHDVTGSSVDGGGGGDPDQLTVEVRGGVDGPADDVPAGASVAPAEPPTHANWRTVSLGADWLVWPGDPDDPDDSALGRINADLGAVDHTGDDGAWASIRVTADTATITRLIPATVKLTIPDRAGVQLRDTRDVETAARILPVANGILRGSRYEAARTAGIAWTGETDNRPAAAVLRSRAFEGPQVHAIRVARSFIQQGETAIYLSTEVDVSSGRVEIQTNPGVLPRLFASVACQTALVETVIPAIGSDLDGETVFELTLLEPLPVDVVDWGGDGIAIRTGVPSFDTSGEFLSWLLTDSTRLNLPADVVDAQSFLAAGSDPTWVGAWRIPDVEPGETLTYADLIDGVLRLTRSAAVMNTVDGLSRITRVRVGAEDAGNVRGTIAAGEIAAGSTPRWDTDERLINAVSLAVDYGRNDDGEYEFRLEESYHSRTSQARFAEVATESIEAGAAGDIDVSDPGAIDSTARAVIATYDSPRRTWRLRTSTAKALSLPLGGTVRVSSPHLRGFVPGPVVEGLAVLVSRRVELATEGADLEFLTFGRRLGGWNAAMLVTADVNDFTVEVDANAFSDVIGPDGLPFQESDSFPALALVYRRPKYNHDGGLNLVVASVDTATNRITFTTVHGASVGDTLIPRGFDEAHDEVDPYAWLAGSDGLLGAGGDEGREYG